MLNSRSAEYAGNPDGRRQARCCWTPGAGGRLRLSGADVGPTRPPKVSLWLDETSELPLGGIRVLDLAGPLGSYCCRLLADAGRRRGQGRAARGRPLRAAARRSPVTGQIRRAASASPTTRPTSAGWCSTTGAPRRSACWPTWARTPTWCVLTPTGARTGGGLRHGDGRAGLGRAAGGGLLHHAVRLDRALPHLARHASRLARHERPDVRPGSARGPAGGGAWPAALRLHRDARRGRRARRPARPAAGRRPADRHVGARGDDPSPASTSTATPTSPASATGARARRSIPAAAPGSAGTAWSSSPRQPTSTGSR